MKSKDIHKLLLLLLLCLLNQFAKADRVVITLHPKHSGRACTIANLLPACIQRLKCYGRRIVASTDGCRQPWIVVEQEIYIRLRGYGEPESIERDYAISLQSTDVPEYNFNDDYIVLQQSSVPTASLPAYVAWATRDWHKEGGYGINSRALLEKYPQHAQSADASNVVAILDTGLRRDAAALAMFDEVVPGVDLISDDTISNDGDGRDLDWGDPGDGHAPSCPNTPSSWHGHKLASIISGHLPRGQVQGVSGGYDGITRAAILPVRILGACKQGWASDLNDALRYAVGDGISGVSNPSKNASVIVMSLVGKAPSCPQFLQDTIDSIRASHPDVVLLAAAGNNHEHVAGVFPANCRGVTSVSATGRDGTMSIYSNQGATVSAPGGGDDGADAIIALSPVNGGMEMGMVTGTSVATAVAAAYVALGRRVYGSSFHIGNSLIPYTNGCSQKRCGAGILSFFHEKNARPVESQAWFKCSPNAYRTDSSLVDMGTIRFPRYAPGEEPQQQPLQYYDRLRSINPDTQGIETSTVPCSDFDPTLPVSAAEYEVPTGSWNFQFSVDSIPQEDWNSMTIQGLYNQKPIRLYGDKTLWQTPTATFITYLNRVEIDLKTSIASMPDFATQSAGFFTVDVTIPLELSKAGEATQAGLGVRVKLGGMGLHLRASTDVVNQGWSTYSFLDADGSTVEQNPTPLELMEYVSVTDDDRYKSIGKLRILFDLANNRVAALFMPDRVFEDGNGFVPAPGTQAWVPFQRDCTEDGCAGGMWYTHDAATPSSWDLFTLEFLGSPMHVDKIDFAMYPEDYFVDENTYEVVRPCGADPLQSVLSANPPAYQFHASQFRNNQFNGAVDVQIQGNPYLIVEAAHGATVPMVVLVGEADTDGLTFPDNTLGQDFTVCALFRLRTNAAGPTNRLFLNTRSPSPETDPGYWNMAPDDANTDWQVQCATSGGGFSYGIGVAAHGPLRLHVNHPDASTAAGAVDWAFISIFIWHKVLQDQDINTVSHWMKSSLTTLKINLANPNGCGAKQSKISDCATDTTNVDFKPWAMWHAADWDAGTNILMDTSGNNRHSQPATGTITYAYEAGNGANVSTASIIGGQSDSIVFPNSAPPKFFTICSLSRWVDPVQHHAIIGADVANRKFAYKDHGTTPANLNSVQVKFSQSTWYHGHGPASRGAVSYGNVKTDTARLATLPGSDTDWIVVCSKNAAGAQSTLVNGDIDVSDSDKTVRVARAFKKNFRGVAAGNIGFNVV